MSLRRWSARLVVAACVAAVLGVGLVGLLALMMPPNTLTIRLSLLSHLPSVVAIAIIIDLLIAGVAVSGVLVRGSGAAGRRKNRLAVDRQLFSLPFRQSRLELCP